MNHIRLKLLNSAAKVPTRSTSGSVGYDIYACLSAPVELQPDESYLFHSGFAISLKDGYAAFIYARSGLGVKFGIIPANCVGVIDSDYRGEVKVGLKNTSKESFTINPGDRIAQMVITKCELPDFVVCDVLDETERGTGGFGSSQV